MGDQELPSVSFVFSETTLLSGGLDDCTSVDDESCEGGIALIRAYMRQFSDGIDESNLVINQLDYESAFVQRHPLEWNVNRLVLHDRFGMEVFFAKPSLLTAERDVIGLRTEAFRPLLYGNAVVSTSNEWSQYTKGIHFDEETGLAVIILSDQIVVSTGAAFSLPVVETTRSLVNYIYERNAAQGCVERTDLYDTYTKENGTNKPPAGQKCWIPVVVNRAPGPIQPFIDAVLGFENQPGILIDINGEDRVSPPAQVGSKGMWVVHYDDDNDILRQLRLTLSADRVRVENVTLLEHDLETIPGTIKDAELEDDIAFLRRLADEAQANDPVLGLSGAMPVSRVDTFRLCFGGECPIGNLFVDALRWYADSDFAFIQSGGVRGPGWSEGPVRASDIWASLPFSNTDCTGLISGVTVYRLFELSTREAQFVAHRITDGDRLFQVSGLRYSYNTQLEAPRLVSLEILNRTTGEYEPVERLKLYSFATTSWMCTGFNPFPSILGDELAIEGEEPKKLGDELVQNIVGKFLSSVHSVEPFDTSIQQRLTNDTSATAILDFIQTPDLCTSSTYWVESLKSCIECPSTAAVALVEEEGRFSGVSGIDEPSAGTAKIVNGENFPINVALKSKPSWTDLVDNDIFQDSGSPKLITIPPSQSLSVDFTVTSRDLRAGQATGVVSFAVLDAGNFPGCVGRDIVYSVSQVVTQSPQLIQEGSIRSVGFSMAGAITAMTIGLSFWVYTRRDRRAVKMMQPVFLLGICLGVFLIGLSIVPRSIHSWSEISPRGQDMACMSYAWLLSMGFSLVVCALLAKLWRINKLIDGARNFRRASISAKKAAYTFILPLVLNFILMLVWTLVDPMQYEIRVAEGGQGKLFGTCTNMDTAGWIFLGMTAGINFFILLFVVYEAYKARDLGEDYSESTGVGLAIYSWLQLVMIVVPVLFLIEDDNVNPRYFLTVSLIFACCVSMTMFIFVPIVTKTMKKEEATPNTGRVFASMGTSVPDSGQATNRFGDRRARIGTNTISEMPMSTIATNEKSVADRSSFLVVSMSGLESRPFESRSSDCDDENEYP